MSDAWYFVDSDEHAGPVSYEQLRKYLVSPRGGKTALVWHKGLSDWKPAGEVKELAGVFAEPPPLPRQVVQSRTTRVPRAAPTLHHVDRWVSGLPWRWARNGAIFAAISSFARLGGSKDIEKMLQNGSVLLSTAVVFVIMIIGSAFLFFMIGLWARRTLLSAPGVAWVSIAKSIPRKWTVGGVLLGTLMVLTDAVFQWRGAKLQSGDSINAIAENVGYVIGAVGTASLLGFVVGLVSRRGLERAISDDGDITTNVFR
jgi:hypothetical protein